MQLILSGIKYLTVILILSATFLSCSPNKPEQKEEQIRITDTVATVEGDSMINSVKGNIAFSHLATTPNSVILTGLPNHRLVTVYKTRIVKSANGRKYVSSYGSYSSYETYDDDGDDEEDDDHFMPGIDIIYGYNLLNIAHYDLKTEKLNYFFDRPALIKTLYYPCFEQDSLNDRPVNRDYYLVSAYDEDTNNDTLLNNKDLRKFYFLSADCNIKINLLPTGFSAIRSEYDPGNDVMYIFARQDTDNNGMGDPLEPIHIFWISLKSPMSAKQLY